MYRQLLLSVLVIALTPSFALSAEESLLYYILDGSGSMWGRVEGKMKIQIAKEVMSDLITETPADIHGGVMVYGHRKKGDCSDIEEIVSIGALDKSSAIEKIKRITPTGMTPISDSITLAIDKVKSAEYSATVVLVSDGIETCDKDPCAVTKALKESGVNFMMHVVGFGISGGAAKQLSCIADAGGGKYFSTSNAEELLSALNTIKEAVVEKKEIIVSTPEPTPEATPIQQQITQTSKSIRIKAHGPGRISFVHDSWLQAPYYWKLVSPETGKEVARFRSLDEQLVAPGEYQIVWRQSEHGASEVTLGEVITVESGKATQVPLRTAIRPVVPSWVKEPRFWGLQNPETKERLSRFVPIEANLVPAGEYNLIWHQAEHGSNTLVLKKVVIEPDKVNEVKLATAINLVPAPWVLKEIRFWSLHDIETDKELAQFRLGFEPQLVPEGKYKVIYRLYDHGASNSYLGDITINPDQMNEFAVNTGVKLIAQPNMEVPYQIMFIELDSTGKELRSVRLSESFGPMPLKPGTYKITYRQSQHGSSTITLVESFELPAGNLVEIEL